MKRALITGITGQDGSYLAELLLDNSYEVWGMHRRTSTPPFERIDHLKDKITLRCGDLTDAVSLMYIMEEAGGFDEIYNLAGQSQVKISFIQPILTNEVNYHGLIRIFETAKRLGIKPKIYQASTSEIFGRSKPPQNEESEKLPVSPYAISKLDAHNYMKRMRDEGYFAATGILFNHESPRRGLEFVTRKIVRGIAEIKAGLSENIKLGNLDAKRDWGYAGEYVWAMWRIMQQKEPDDYVIATGETHSVREFIEEAGRVAGLKDPLNYVVIDEKQKRPVDVDFLCGDSTKAREKFGWNPRIKFEGLADMMMKAETEIVRRLVNSGLYYK